MLSNVVNGVVSGRWRVAGRRSLWCGLLFTLLLWSLTSCVGTAPVLKIALVAPFEGEHRAIGYDALYSARLAVREVNEQGGIDGRKIALVALDDGGDGQLARETAVALTLNPAVIAVVGHWQADTSAVAAPIYAQHNLPFLTLGTDPFIPYPSDQLPGEFKSAYAAVTPFDETADIYAGSTYDAFQLLFAALEEAAAHNQPFTRQTMHNFLQNSEVNGITGIVYPNTHLPNEE